MTELNHLINDYAKRLHQRMAAMNCPEPGTPESNAEIGKRLRNVLGIKNEWVPEIHAEVIEHRVCDGIEVKSLRFVSWSNFFGTATFYLPANASAAVLLAPGHHPRSKFAPDYQRMAQILASGGIAVLMPDVIGSGERIVQGHTNVPNVLDCGTTLGGLIALEDSAWLDWLHRNCGFEQVGALGNSGGGQAVLLLCALWPEKLALAAPSGFPGTFEFTARKTRRLCACSIMPGIVGTLEMYHCLGCMYPKPLLIGSGEGDPMFPRDQVLTLNLQLAALYGQSGNYAMALTSGGHSWGEDRERYERIANFIFNHLGQSERTLEKLPQPFFSNTYSTCNLPKEGIGVDELASRLTGKPLRGIRHLWEIFPDPSPQNGLSDEMRHICTQLESFLHSWDK